jgi:uncharacterized protein YfaS (alpha-2-macroglobulin family)
MKKAVVFILLILIFCCDKKEELKPTIAEQLQQYLDLEKVIIQTPPTLVSITADLNIAFSEPVIPNHLVGSVLDKNPFSFEPEIEGSAQWISQKMLRFSAADNLPAGKTVAGILNGKIAFGEQKNVNDFRFTFKVAEQEILSLQGDFEAATGIKNGVNYNGILEFAQAVDIEKIKDDLAFRSISGKVGLQISTTDEAQKVRVASDVILRKDDGQNFEFSLPNRYTAGDEKWVQKIFLPGINIFRVLAHMDMSGGDEAQLTYGFRFNDPIKKNMDLSGYVKVSPETPYQVHISGKYLLIQGDFLPGRPYQLTIMKGFPSAFETKLSRDYTSEFFFNNIKPEIKWLSRGIYIPTANEYKLQFKSVNVARVNITITEIYPQNLGFFIQRNNLFDSSERTRPRNYYDRVSYQDLSRVGEQVYSKQLQITSLRNKWIKTELDLGAEFRPRKNSAFVISLNFSMRDLTGHCTNSRQEIGEGDLYYEDDDYYSNPCKHGYYYSRGNLAKLLISSDLGLTVKRAEDGLHVFASNVQNARPVQNLSLNLYTYYNQLVQSSTTNTDGYAVFSEEGSYIFANDPSGIALIKVDNPAWQLNNFDISGSTGGIQGTNVFMYTDRGVHRPGDTIHLAAIIRMKNDTPPEKQPVIITVKNSRGQTVNKEKTSCGFNGHIYFPLKTDQNDPTGEWTAQLKVGDQTFSKIMRVETVKPNRLKIAIDIPREIIPPRLVLQGTLECKYLFGAPAANLKSNIQVDLSDRRFTNDKFADYIFSTPLKQFAPRSLTIYSGSLDAQGRYRFNYNFPTLVQAPGLVSAVINATIYEKGGNFTQHSISTTVYPYDAYVGIKDLFKSGAVKVGDDFEVPIVVVNHIGNPLRGRKLKVSLYVNRDHWWWHYDYRDRKDFKRMESTYLIGEYNYTSGVKPIKHKLLLEDYGRHLIEVTDLSSGHQAAIFFYATGWGRVAIEEKERNYLQITSDKNVYNIGDRATLTFDSPAQGMALFTLEQGNKILDRMWKPVTEKQTSFSFAIAEEMVPNCYASISLVQPHNQNTNDLPMRLYGIKTLYVEDHSTHLQLQLSVPQELKPKERFTIQVTSQARQKASYTLAVVDEGLLDLTDFKTPDPWDYYFQKIRLGVNTVDNFDEIIGILYPDIDKYFSIGGGIVELAKLEREKRLAEDRVKRFKAVVLYQEPITIEAGKTKSTSFTMPNYVGAVRIMMVGAGGNSYTSAERTVAVKQPLMILPTIPRVARPGDVFTLPVSVFAMDSTVSNVKVTLVVSKNLIIKGAAAKTLIFKKPGEKDIEFLLSVGNALGTDSIRVIASAGDLTTDYTVNLPITSPNPFFTEVTDTMVTELNPISLTPKKFGLDGTNKAKIAFSRIPDIQLDKRYTYLIRYPYGCIEQTVSSAFPQLFLHYLLDLKAHQKQAVTDNINSAIKKLSKFQINNGFSFWPVSNTNHAEYSDWGSSYTGHFLVEARSLGYHIPEALYDHWLRNAQREAKSVNRKNHRFQTYRLFILALADEANIGAMNLVRENYMAELDPLSRKLLAAAYYIAGKEGVAVDIDRTVQTEIIKYRETSGTYGSALRDLALMTYLCLKMNDLNTASRLLQRIVRSFTPHGWYSTQETAMALLCISSFYKTSPFTGGTLKFQLKLGDEKLQEMTLNRYQEVIDLDNMWDKEIKITTASSDPLFVTLMVEGIPLDNRIKTEHQGIELTRNFYSEEGMPIIVDDRLQGDPFWVIYSVRSAYNTTLEELALSSIFPSGWEIINLRLQGGELPDWVREIGIQSGEYMDIRDDRVNWFFDLKRNQKIYLGVKINPTFKGVYKLPPVVAEAMYSPEFYAHIAGGQVQVK